MKRLALALTVAAALFASASAQDVPNMSPPQSLNGAYNVNPPTCVDGHGCWLQTDVNGQLKISGSWTGSDGSTTITLGGTAQNLFSAATPANGFAVYNPDASEDCWISLSTTAVANGTGSIRVAANGGGYETPPHMRPFHAISIVCATTGHKFTAIQW